MVVIWGCGEALLGMRTETWSVLKPQWLQHQAQYAYLWSLRWFMKTQVVVNQGGLIFEPPGSLLMCWPWQEGTGQVGGLLDPGWCVWYWWWQSAYWINTQACRQQFLVPEVVVIDCACQSSGDACRPILRPQRGVHKYYQCWMGRLIPWLSADMCRPIPPCNT